MGVLLVMGISPTLTLASFTMTTKLVRLLFLASCLILTGCGVTRQEAQDLHQSISNLTVKLKDLEVQQQEVQISQADLTESIRALGSTLESLVTKLEENENKMSGLSMRLDDVGADMSERVSLLAELITASGGKLSEKPAPSAIYALAYTDFIRGRYKQAINGFQTYLEQAPKGEKGPNAQLYLGESYASLDETDKAIAEYDRVIENYPLSNVVPTSYFKKALVLEKQGKKEDAIELYKRISSKYPGRKEDAMAKERLKYLEGVK